MSDFERESASLERVLLDRRGNSRLWRGNSGLQWEMVDCKWKWWITKGNVD